MKTKTKIVLNITLAVVFALTVIFAEDLFGTDNQNMVEWTIAILFIASSLVINLAIKDKS